MATASTDGSEASVLLMEGVRKGSYGGRDSECGINLSFYKITQCGRVLPTLEIQFLDL